MFYTKYKIMEILDQFTYLRHQNTRLKEAKVSNNFSPFSLPVERRIIKVWPKKKKIYSKYKNIKNFD